jgi:hypothetical protein
VRAQGREWLVLLACMLAFLVVVMVRPGRKPAARGRARTPPAPSSPAATFRDLVYGVSSRSDRSDEFQPYSYWRLDHVREDERIVGLGFGRVCATQQLARAAVGRDVILPVHEVAGGLALREDGAVLFPREAADPCAAFTLSDVPEDADGSVWGLVDPYSGFGGAVYSRFPGRLPIRGEPWEGERRVRIACEPAEVVATPAGRILCRVLRYERSYVRRYPTRADTVDVAGRAWIAPGTGVVRSVERVQHLQRSHHEGADLSGDHVVERRVVEIVPSR